MPIKANELIKRWEKLNSGRAIWNGLWNDIIKYVTPGQTLAEGYSEPGTIRTARVYDSTAIYANSVLASGLYGFLCPPHSKWFSPNT